MNGTTQTAKSCIQDSFPSSASVSTSIQFGISYMVLARDIVVAVVLMLILSLNS